MPHSVLKSLLGAWALAACSPQESVSVEEHLGVCGVCAEEALRLREAVGLLHPAEPLDLDPALRMRLLGRALERRPPRIPLPRWAQPYDAEAARLDALLQDIRPAEWHVPVELRWYEEELRTTTSSTTVAGVLTRLLSADNLVARALGLPEAGTDQADEDQDSGAGPGGGKQPSGRAIRRVWREQSHEVVRTVAFAGGGSGRLPVPYGRPVFAGREALPLCDAMVERAFACWVHAVDIADAVEYPYEPPAPRHLHAMIDLAARQLPAAVDARRRAGRGGPARPVGVGSPGRSLRLEVEGAGGGQWLIPLDSPHATGSAAHEVAHLALDGVEFCRLAAGRVAPREAVAGEHGDRDAVHEVLCAASRLAAGG
ncbi:MDMPI N domain containing protein [Streptomyces sp. NA04227]|nr:MDMPI N domain containing protein [Streptomyces sp. NA04227]